MNEYFYIATNMWGHGRSLTPGNGWTITAYRDKETRDKIYDELSYERTGCTIPSKKDINDILGTDSWGVSEGLQTDNGGFDVVPRYL